MGKANCCCRKLTLSSPFLLQIWTWMETALCVRHFLQLEAELVWPSPQLPTDVGDPFVVLIKKIVGYSK